MPGPRSQGAALSDLNHKEHKGSAAPFVFFVFFVVEFLFPKTQTQSHAIWVPAFAGMSGSN